MERQLEKLKLDEGVNSETHDDDTAKIEQQCVRGRC